MLVSNKHITPRQIDINKLKVIACKDKEADEIKLRVFAFDEDLEFIGLCFYRNSFIFSAYDIIKKDFIPREWLQKFFVFEEDNENISEYESNIRYEALAKFNIFDVDPDDFIDVCYGKYAELSARIRYSEDSIEIRTFK